MFDKISRESLLRSLELVQPGLTKKADLDQSNCFCFQDGEVFTFNDKIACRCATPLDKEITGAVVAEKLLEILKKLPDDEIRVSQTDNYLQILGKGGRKSKHALQSEIRLPINMIERPTEDWVEIHPKFCEAVGLVHHSALKEDSLSNLVFVHINPDFVEACDNAQLTRYTLKTGVSKSLLINQEDIRHISKLHMTHLCETDSWVHFKNDNGLILSCRRHTMEFPDLSAPLELENPTKASLNPKISRAVDTAMVFSKEQTDSNNVRVELTTNRMLIVGTGITGEYSEPPKVEYNGPDIKFLINPKTLLDLVKKQTEIEIVEDRIRIKGDDYVHIICLLKNKDENKSYIDPDLVEVGVGDD